MKVTFLDCKPIIPHLNENVKSFFEKFKAGVMPNYV